MDRHAPSADGNEATYRQGPAESNEMPDGTKIWHPSSHTVDDLINSYHTAGDKSGANHGGGGGDNDDDDSVDISFYDEDDLESDDEEYEVASESTTDENGNKKNLFQGILMQRQNSVHNLMDGVTYSDLPAPPAHDDDEESDSDDDDSRNMAQTVLTPRTIRRKLPSVAPKRQGAENNNDAPPSPVIQPGTTKKAAWQIREEWKKKRWSMNETKSNGLKKTEQNGTVSFQLQKRYSHGAVLMERSKSLRKFLDIDICQEEQPKIFHPKPSDVLLMTQEATTSFQF